MVRCDGNGAFVIVRIPAALDGQHIGHKEHILHIGHFVAVTAAAVDGSDLDVTYLALGGTDVVQIYAAGGDGQDIAHCQHFRTHVSKAAAGGVLGAAPLFVDLIQPGEHRVLQALGFSDRDLPHPIVQLGVFHLFFCGEEIQIADGRALLAIVQFEPCRLVQQLHLVGLAGLQHSGHRGTADGVIHGHIAACDIDEFHGGFYTVSGHAHHIKGICTRLKFRAGHIIWRFHGLHFFSRRRLGIEGHVFCHGVARFHPAGQFGVIVPAQEDHPGLGRRGQAADEGVLRGGLGGGKADVRLTAAQRKLHFVIGGLARPSTGGAASARRPAACGGRFRLDGWISGLGVDADPLGRHAGFLIPGLHRFVCPHTQCGRLGAAGIARRIKIYSVAVQKAGFPQLQDRVPRIGGNRVDVRRRGGDHRVSRIVHIKILKIAHKKYCHLLPVDERIGGELPAARTSRDPVLHRPCHIRGIIGVCRYIAEAAHTLIAIGIYSSHPPQHRDEHPAGHGPVWRKGRFAGAAEKTVDARVLHSVIEPVCFLHIGKWVCLLRRCSLCIRNGKSRGWDQRDYHNNRQQQAEYPFFHIVHSSSLVILESSCFNNNSSRSNSSDAAGRMCPRSQRDNPSPMGEGKGASPLSLNTSAQSS